MLKFYSKSRSFCYIVSVMYSFVTEQNAEVTYN